MRRARTAAVALLLCGYAGAAPAQLLECRGAQRQQEVAELMFGRKVGDRLTVSESAFARFLDREIAPRFPDGLNVYSTVGYWRDPTTNRTVREPSKTVHIVLPGNAEDLERLNEIVQAYKAQFKQQGVGMIVRPACVSF
jgi:hypothetical protein